MNLTKSTFNPTVADAVQKGLTASPKSLPSWLFYDEAGDELFRKIMRMPEYYPTRCEYDILQHYREDLLTYFKADRSDSFRLIELGAGDGLKTEILLTYFLAKNASFTYLPIDISSNALDRLSTRLKGKLPGLPIQTIHQNYDDALVKLRDTDGKKVILFLGANIGNFSTTDASLFLRKLALPLSGEDLLLIGFDLKKDPRVIQQAYDDPAGLTAAFNLNILTRLNRELAADFDPRQFAHFPCYDPVDGTTKSFLISMKDQDVHLQALERSIHFGLWEALHTEVSQKYDVSMIEKLMSLSGLHIMEIFYDKERYFCDVLLKIR